MTTFLRRCHSQYPIVPQACSGGHSYSHLDTGLQRIGKGTYGKVYLGVHRRTGYEVAIKALNKKKIAAQKMTEKARPTTHQCLHLILSKYHFF
jgi:hypothetical protein